ncbi:uncharacterized protein F4822DRAFT_193702 [Hypoxylon trugodes]|uniref:uncharacterized protein n=1 Tax=Hypoxylon trugodes TaxID=326681 RepID=UPI002198C22E|nr:uncharacterized protein F4822DRAFT_193702 [Hypoxylon trugodes]KAI1391718.1 hypothetical protein F4822DRAFT_193702 [Hypoxylon trugodes]
MILYYGSVVLLILAIIAYNFKTSLLAYIQNTPVQNLENRRTGLALKECVNDNDSLAKLWRESNGTAVIFASIDVHTWDVDQRRITDIRVSTWCPSTNHESDIDSYHWQIEDNMALKNRNTVNNPNIFAFRATEVIRQTQISPTMDSVFKPLTTRFTKTIIVGHNIYRTVALLENHWKPPAAAEFLDTQRIWQFQHRRLDAVTLEKALQTSPEASYDKALFNNAGNDAQFILRLLQAQSCFPR